MRCAIMFVSIGFLNLSKLSSLWKQHLVAWIPSHLKWLASVLKNHNDQHCWTFQKYHSCNQKTTGHQIKINVSSFALAKDRLVRMVLEGEACKIQHGMDSAKSFFNHLPTGHPCLCRFIFFLFSCIEFNGVRPYKTLSSVVRSLSVPTFVYLIAWGSLRSNLTYEEKGMHGNNPSVLRSGTMLLLTPK